MIVLYCLPPNAHYLPNTNTNYFLLCSISSSKTSILIPASPEAISHHGTFAFAVPSARNALPSGNPVVLHCTLLFLTQMSPVGDPSLITPFKMATARHLWPFLSSFSDSSFSRTHFVIKHPAYIFISFIASLPA